MFHKLVTRPATPCRTDSDRKANIALTVNEMKGAAALAFLSRPDSHGTRQTSVRQGSVAWPAVPGARTDAQELVNPKAMALRICCGRPLPNVTNFAHRAVCPALFHRRRMWLARHATAMLPDGDACSGRNSEGVPDKLCCLLGGGLRRHTLRYEP